MPLYKLQNHAMIGSSLPVHALPQERSKVHIKQYPSREVGSQCRLQCAVNPVDSGAQRSPNPCSTLLSAYNLLATFLSTHIPHHSKCSMCSPIGRTPCGEALHRRGILHCLVWSGHVSGHKLTPGGLHSMMQTVSGMLSGTCNAATSMVLPVLAILAHAN